MGNLYERLEVLPRASQEVIGAAFRTLMKASFQSKEDNAEEKRRGFEEAYKILSDPDKRAEYDQNRLDLRGKVIVDKYRVLELVTQEEVSDVYRGEHLLLEEPIWLKHCSNTSKEAEEMLLGEARALWDLRHHSLPAIRDVLRLEDGTVAVVTSYIPGPTWAQMIEKNGAMHPEPVTWLAERVLNVLRFIHVHAGLIHGNVNPQKIIIQPEYVMASLIGFELALSAAHVCRGSRGYSDIFSPLEAVQGMPLLPGSDLYGLGMTMVYALNGDLKETRKKSVPESTPDLLCNFIKRLIARDVLERPSWEDEDLCETLAEIKIKSFGKKSKIKPIPW